MEPSSPRCTGTLPASDTVVSHHALGAGLASRAALPVLLPILLSLAVPPAPMCGATGADQSKADGEALVAALFADDALAAWHAERKLVAMGDRAVPALTRRAQADDAGLPGRLTAVECLGRIGTPAAADALIDQLRTEKHLAVRGQICMQLGRAGAARAVPVIAAWLQDIGPRSLNDVRGPKEVQPSTCYARHVEALAMIGDDEAIGVLEAFEKRIPRGVGFGGFLSNFVLGAVGEALEELRDLRAFRQAVRKHPGLEAKIAPLLEHFRTDGLARFRLHDDKVVRGTAEGKAILQRLTAHPDAATAAGAKALLAVYDRLERQVAP